MLLNENKEVATDDNAANNDDRNQDKSYIDPVSTYNDVLVAKKKNVTALVNKRIDFDPRTLKRIEMMLPAYRDEAGENSSTNDVMSFVIAKGIDALFDSDFRRKIEEM